MSKSDPKRTVSHLLSDWQVSPSTDPQFKQHVWRRIGQRRKESAWPGYLRTHAAVAASLALLAAVGGGVLGYAQAREQSQERREAMVSAYVESMDMSAQLAQR